MKNSEYWQKRFLLLEERMNAHSRKTIQDINPVFERAKRQIQKEIDIWITRIAKNNEVSIDEARRLLDAKELKEFKWDLAEYIKYGEENGISGKCMKQLENASARYHIDRLEALKIRVQQEAERTFGNELDHVDRMAREVYSESRMRSIFEIQRGFNTGWNIAQIDQGKLDRILSKPWAADGKNFSDRIWQSKGTMINELHQELTRISLLGGSVDKAIEHMSQFVDKKFKNAKAQATRLVMTEQAFFASSALGEVYKELGAEEFEIVATLDSITSEICKHMDGRHFPVTEYQPGATAPPFHPGCRSSTCPYFDDEFTVGEERAARGEDGKTHYVPADMTFPEWEEKFVKSRGPFYDNSNRWKEVSPDKAGAVTDLMKYKHEGKEYEVDGKRVKLDYSKEEKEVADLLSKRYGKQVQMVPRVIYPPKINTPDYIIDQKNFDLKTPTGAGKNTIYDMIKAGKRQASNFIIRLDKTNLTMKQVEDQIRQIYISSHTKTIDEIVILKNGVIEKVYRRK